MSRTKAEIEKELASETPSAERRRMLRAAAAAPFLATLPGGAAYAMASASQCVIDSKKESDMGVPVMSEGARDKWVRRKVTTQIFGTTQGGTEVSKQLWLIDGKWYDEDGNEVSDVDATFPPTEECDFDAGFCAISPPQDAFVLQIFEPDYDATGDPDAPNAVHTVGIYPIDSIQYYRPAAPAANMGITGTCLCSVDPAYGGSQYC